MQGADVGVLLEHGAEVVAGRPAQVVGDVGDALARLAQQLLGLLDLVHGDVLGRGLARDLAEEGLEAGERVARVVGQLLEGHGLGDVLGDVVHHPQDAVVGGLGGCAVHRRQVQERAQEADQEGRALAAALRGHLVEAVEGALDQREGDGRHGNVAVLQRPQRLGQTAAVDRVQAEEVLVLREVELQGVEIAGVDAVAAGDVGLVGIDDQRLAAGELEADGPAAGVDGALAPTLHHAEDLHRVPVVVVGRGRGGVQKRAVGDVPQAADPVRAAGNELVLLRPLEGVVHLHRGNLRYALALHRPASLETKSINSY